MSNSGNALWLKYHKYRSMVKWRKKQGKNKESLRNFVDMDGASFTNFLKDFVIISA